jgi:hypothetical protein
MRVLKLYSADHPGNLEQMPEASWPVWDSQSGIVAGDQPAGNDQQESQRGNKHGKAMMSGVIRGGGQNCSLEVLVILTSGFASPGKYKPLKRRGKEEAGIGIAKSPELPKIAKIEKHTTNN